jgi:2,4-dienoyl-CoA reductase-like NADH-dependent reductase (Old Yellow Enzyme family)
MTRTDSALFSAFQLRDVRFKNRIMVSPMNQYSAHEGMAGDWHFAHLAQFAIGGAGFVCLEATKVERRGLGSVGDLGLWDDAQVPALRRIVDFLHSQGAVAGIQLNHAGRKAGALAPWDGFGPIDKALHLSHLHDYPGIAPSAIPFTDAWPVPREMSLTEIAECIDAFASAAKRADQAGMDVVEVHGAHGYLVHQFLSPLSNQRTDRYGGSLDNRMRFALEVCEAIRAVWPAGKPLLFRISAQDETGWSLDDSLQLTQRLRKVGVDAVDCSSGGINSRSKNMSAATLSRQLGFQVPFAETLRRETGMPTIAVGLIIHAEQAEAIVANGQADMVAIAREMLFDPFWAVHAAATLGVDPGFDLLPKPYGWWLDRRERAGYERESAFTQPQIRAHALESP